LRPRGDPRPRQDGLVSDKVLNVSILSRSRTNTSRVSSRSRLRQSVQRLWDGPASSRFSSSLTPTTQTDSIRNCSHNLQNSHWISCLT